MNTRSINFRLISWYTGLITCVCLAFGGYAYHGLNDYLAQNLITTLERRTTVIGQGMLTLIPDEGLTFVQQRLDVILASDRYSRFVRISDSKGTVIYRSGTPKDASFDPAAIMQAESNIAATYGRKHNVTGGEYLVILTSPYILADGTKYVIEVGQTTATLNSTLNTLLLALGFAMPMVLLVSVGGGYMLVRKALKPIENIRRSLEDISISNLKRRLPVNKTGDNIEGLSTTLNRMIHRLDESYQQTSRFSADASHELRTPLTVMRGELESIILDDSLPVDIQERLGSVLEETTRLAQITEGLFAISRLDTGEARMQHKCVDLTNLVKITLDQMQLLAVERNITVTCNTNLTYLVAGDPSRLKQVVVNLLDNAIKYTQEGGKITLKVRASHKKVVLEVTDNGIGISEKDLPHIFERFYRADKVRSRELGGAGLGLSIVRSICLAHHGEIRAENVETGGTRFTMELPLFSRRPQENQTE